MKTLFGAALLLVAGSVFALPVTHISQGSEWEYMFISEVGPAATINSATYDTYLDRTAGGVWNTGNAGFGNTTAPAGGVTNTSWSANTDIAIRQSFTLDGLADDVALNVAVDNGYAAFLNGTKIGSASAGGFAGYWEYLVNVNVDLLLQGTNELVLLGEDYGGLTYLDAQLFSSNVQPLPPTTRASEPSIIALFALGLMGLIYRRRSHC